MLSLICGTKNKTKQKQTHRYRKQTSGNQSREGMGEAN